jgi:hypothetical protein
LSPSRRPSSIVPPGLGSAGSKGSRTKVISR